MSGIFYVAVPLEVVLMLDMDQVRNLKVFMLSMVAPSIVRRDGSGIDSLLLYLSSVTSY